MRKKNVTGHMGWNGDAALRGGLLTVRQRRRQCAAMSRLRQRRGRGTGGHRPLLCAPGGCRSFGGPMLGGEMDGSASAIRTHQSRWSDSHQRETCALPSPCRTTALFIVAAFSGVAIGFSFLTNPSLFSPQCIQRSSSMAGPALPLPYFLTSL